MIKSTFCILSFAFLLIVTASCAKSNKGKLANNWKVSTLDEQSESVNSNGDIIKSDVSMTETFIRKESQYTSNGFTTYSSSDGIVKGNEFTIQKDGTWSWTQVLAYSNDNGYGSHRLFEQAGTWNFIGKEGKFKKNERVLFNILTDKYKTTTTQYQTVVSTQTDSSKYQSGENTMLYTISFSKKNRLKMELEKNDQYTDDNGDVISYKISQQLILSDK